MINLRKSWGRIKCRLGWEPCASCNRCLAVPELAEDPTVSNPGSGIRAVAVETRERSERRHKRIDGAIDRYADAQERQTSASLILERSALDLRAPTNPTGSARHRDQARPAPAR